jgi:hypothetical protein
VRNIFFVSLMSVAAVCLMFSFAHADKRSYVWTYEYKTVERGKAEMESYVTLSSPDIDAMKGATSAEHQIELEVGMTERFDFSVYQVFGQEPDEALRYEGFKLRSRYRFGKRGEYFMDPLAYVEYKGVPDLSEHGIEFKLILARDIGGFNVSLNPVLELKYEEEWEVEPEYAVGASYQVDELLRVGMEAKGSEDAQYIGPVVSHGSDDLWVTLGSALKTGGVKEGKAGFELRMLLGVGL